MGRESMSLTTRLRRRAEGMVLGALFVCSSTFRKAVKVAIKLRKIIVAGGVGRFNPIDGAGLLKGFEYSPEAGLRASSAQ
jgi:hypothetical protein